MGDRGNIVVLNKKYGTDEYEGVWLYSHWGGHRLEGTARKAVANCGRVGDPSYLARIIFCNMIADGFRDLDTGLMGRELIEREMAKGDVSEMALFLGQMVDEFLSETGYGISLEGAGDQEYPTVCVDADTGKIWTDPNLPTRTSQITFPAPIGVV